MREHFHGTNAQMPLRGNRALVDLKLIFLRETG